MSLILRNDNARFIQQAENYIDYIFYTDLKLDPNKFQIFHLLEFVVGQNTSTGSFDVYILIGDGEEYYIGTYSQVGGRTHINKV